MTLKILYSIIKKIIHYPPIYFPLKDQILFELFMEKFFISQFKEKKNFNIIK
jgi:hypothetical protein